jgi:HEAT repeat protein
LHAREDELAVDTLIELSDDPESWVRDWATFGLGTMIRRDDQRVREALAARLTDTDDTTRAEAIRGLAVRHDERAIPQLLSELDQGTELDDPAILEEALCALAANSPDDDLCRHVDRLVTDWQTACPNENLPADLQQAVRSCQDNR